jgi:DNA polymerase-3 subunit delta'
MSKYIHPDVHFFFPKPSAKSGSDEKKDAVQNSNVADFRDFLLENPFGTVSDWIIKSGAESKQVQISKDDALRIIKTVSMKSFEGGLKILILWYPEFMNVSSANAILKVLEEPPTETIYLLVTYQYENLLSTILSRTQHILVPRFSREEIQTYLVQNLGLDSKDAEKRAGLAEGSISNALAVGQQEDQNNADDFQSWMRFCFKADYGSLITKSEDFHKIGKNAQRNLLEYSMYQLRNALVFQLIPENTSIEENEVEFIQKFGQSLSPDQVEAIYIDISKTLQHLERNANPRLTFLALSNRIASIFNRQ